MLHMQKQRQRRYCVDNEPNFRYCKGCNSWEHINLTVSEAKMCSRQAVSKGRLRSYKAAFCWRTGGIRRYFFLLCIQIFGSKKRAGKWFPPPKCGPKNGTVSGAFGICANIRFLPASSKNGSQFRPRFWPHFFTFWNALHCFYTKKRKTGNSKITISFLSTQLQQPQERCCTCRNNDNDAIVLTMNQTFDTVRAAIPENTSTWLFLKQRCVQDKQYLKGDCGVIKLHFAEELVAFDGIFSCCIQIFGSKKRAGKWFPPPKCGPKNGTVFGALGICANIRILPASSKNGSQFRPRFWPHFSTFWNALHCFSIHKKAQNRQFQNHNFFLVNAATAASRKMLHMQKQRQRRYWVDNEPDFRYSGGPSSTWQKSQFLDPEAGLWTAQKIWTATCQAFPKSWKETARKVKHTKTVASLCGKWETHNGNRDNSKELWKPTGNRQENNKPEKNPKHTTQNWQAKLRKARNGNLHKNGNLTLQKKEVCRKWREYVFWRLTADTEIVTKSALRTESSIWPDIANVETLQHENL